MNNNKTFEVELENGAKKHGKKKAYFTSTSYINKTVYFIVLVVNYKIKNSPYRISRNSDSFGEKILK